MPKVRRVDYSPDEYISGVGNVLRADEQGVYWMVCSLIMSEGGPIDNNERRLAGLCLLRPSDAKRIVGRLLQLGKIDLTEDGKLSQKRAQDEVKRSAKRIQTAAENGSKGGRPERKSKEKQQSVEAAGSSPAKLTINYQLSTEEETSEQVSDVRTKPAKRRNSYSDRFQEFWSGYPVDPLMSKAKAAVAFGKLEDEDQEKAIRSVPAFAAYCAAHPDYRPVHAVKFITDRRFDGFIKTVEAAENREFVALGTDVWKAILRLRGVVSLPHKEYAGRQGWTFDKREIDRARRLGPPIEWQTKGAA